MAVRHTWIVSAVGCAATAIGVTLGSCTSFDEQAAPVEAGSDASDGAGEQKDAGPTKTPVMCRGVACAAGETCCVSSVVGTSKCAAGAAACRDGGYPYSFECGRGSDCDTGQVCCITLQFPTTCGGVPLESKCTAAANCVLCGAAVDAGSARACDPGALGGTDCPPAWRCARMFAGSAAGYVACEPQ